MYKVGQIGPNSNTLNISVTLLCVTPQAMIENFHETLFPVLQNFLMVIYDIGLEESQRREMEKHCRCKVVTFPFDMVPDHAREILCYAWKPFILAAHLEQAEVLMWADASVRFINPQNIPTIIQRTKERGIQQKTVERSHPLPFYTIPMIFEHFQDSPCAYMSFQMVEANFMLFHREPLIRRAVIQPLLACAGRPDCMCPPEFTGRKFCQFIRQPLDTIGLSNCFDQSALTLILAKLFREKYEHFIVDTSYVQETHRGDRRDYFKELEERAPSGLSEGGNRLETDHK